MNQTYRKSNTAVKILRGHCIDHHNVEWKYEAQVSVTRCGEIRSVDLHYIEGMDEDGTEVLPSRTIISAIEELASTRALERIEEDDFIMEE